VKERAYFLACATIFLVVSAAHLTRAVFGWDVTIAGCSIPPWISIPGAIVPGLLSAWGFVLAFRGGRRGGGGGDA